MVIPMVIYVALLGATSGNNLFGSAYNAGWNYVFGLSDTDTAVTYRTANIDAAAAYRDELCSDGSCLTNVDWQCGFTTQWQGDESDHYGEFYQAIDDCFANMVQVADDGAPLLKLKRICGRHFMVFRPRSTERSPEDCAAAGGEWGTKAVLWEDEALLRIMAGMQEKSNIAMEE